MVEEDINYRDLSNCSESEISIYFSEIVSHKIDNKEEIFFMWNFDGVFLSSLIKSEINDILNNDKIHINALVLMGIGRGVRRLILQSINFPIYFAEDKEDGVDWLLNQ